MWINGLGLFAIALVAAVEAFRDTSPFFLFSTHKLPAGQPLTSLNRSIPLTSRQLQSASSVSADVSRTLTACPSDSYIIISQPGVHASDYSSDKVAPQLRHRVLKQGNEIHTVFAVSEVVGNLDVDGLQKILERECGVEVSKVDSSSRGMKNVRECKGLIAGSPLLGIIDGVPQERYTKKPQVIRVDFPSLAATNTNRSEYLVKNDEFLAVIIDRLSSRDYTVLYVTTAREFAAMEIEIEGPAVYDQMDADIYQNLMRTNMKRGNMPHSQSHREDDDKWKGNKGPLFERYQFFSPGASILPPPSLSIF
ncbi:hypothetical protein ACO22_07735 [Paracoccidioides brasiliensis]|uniref:Protein BIG1 n=1 Tax=Paracoccidioides brasiliensis TaxID=121759 RepID=A0A1D2J497_PARBR|nr:hypothetical protein ACO22_07735 [Paracoccidioides brasiliensis]